MRSLFIYDSHDLDTPIAGGVQLCSREFLGVVQAASDETQMLAIKVTKAPTWRLRRYLGLGSYLLYNPTEFRESLVNALKGFLPSHIFLNRSELIRVAPLAARLAPDAKIVVLSHGNQSGDDLYEVAGVGGRRSSGLSWLTGTWQIGLDLVTESQFRHRHLHGVCVMSDEEEILERWLGARRTLVVPRIIHPSPLEWNPVPGRAGFVGTLDHTPNRIALERLCDELGARDTSALEFRLAGGPEEQGRALAARFRFVHYIGRPDDIALQKEVAGWSLYLNPIFWLSRGASMKLGQSLSWAVPAITTQTGARGYRLAPGQTIMTDDSAGAFATQLLASVEDRERLTGIRECLLRSAAEWPTAHSLGAELKAKFVSDA
jgi:hypothetical protein